MRCHASWRTLGGSGAVKEIICYVNRKDERAKGNHCSRSMLTNVKDKEELMLYGLLRERS